MPMQPGDTLVAHNFGIQIDGVMVEYLAGISGMTDEIDVIEYQQLSAQGKPITRKLPGPPKGGEVTVTRGAERSPTFTEWIKQSREGQMGQSRKNASIIFQDTSGEEVKRYDLVNAWARSSALGDVKAGDTSPVEETVVIVYEELTAG